MAKIAIALTVVILLQLVLTIYQLQQYQGFMNKLVKKYHGTQDFQLASEVVKSRMFSQVVAVVFDKSKTIVEAYYLNGLTIFSKFQPYDQLVGKQLDENLLSSLEEKQGGRLKAVTTLVERYKDWGVE